MKHAFDTVEEILDTSAALEGVGGDQEFFWEMLGIFRAAWPTLMHEIREALVKGDLPQVEDAAHILKAGAQNVAARRVYMAALLLEKMATYGELEGARQACGRLEEEIGQLQVAVESLGNRLIFFRC